MMLTHLLFASGACLPVESDRIRIADLAAAFPAFAQSDMAESIGFAPAPGSQRRYSAGEMNRLAARKGVAAPLAAVCFERKLEALTRERVLEALRNSLPEGAGLELIEFGQAQVAKGSIEFLRSGLTRAPAAAPRDPMIWRGRAKYGVAQSIPVWAKVRVWISRPAVLAVQDLAVGEPIHAQHVRLESIATGPFSGDAIVSMEQVVGMTPRRPIRAGKVVPRSALEAPVDVTRGEMVGAEASYGAAFLKFEVRAEASGRTGDSIPVRNVGSGKTLRARVMRKGWVAVEPIK
jgi:flagella basal body P-ring formation protein FlgA